MAYTTEDLENAVATYVTGNGSYRSIASMFGVPKSTLREKILKYVQGCNEEGPIKNKRGRPTVLLEEDEIVIANWVRNMAKAGFPVTNKELLDSVQHTLNKAKRVTSFDNNRPAETWLPKFRQRHNLSIRTAEILDPGKSQITPRDLRQWANHVEEYFNDHGLEGIFTDPERSFNCDESFFLVSPGKGKVLAELGSKDVYLSLKSSAKTGVSILATVSASGWILPPFLIFPYERSQPWMAKEKTPPGIEVFCTKKGWMTADAFCHWLVHQFVPQLKDRKVLFPVVLYLDGHRSHINIRISEICTENNIVLICFPPNTTHILQPCDVALFKPLKSLWRAKVHEWSGKHANNRVTVKNMIPLLNEVWEDLSPKYGQNGFRVCGLYPWNPDAVDFSKCLAKDDGNQEAEVERHEDFEADVDMPSSSLNSLGDLGAPQRSSSPLENFPDGFPDCSQSRYTPVSENHTIEDCRHLRVNPSYIGHAILAEFEKKISPVIIDSFIRILKTEEIGEVSEEFRRLNDMDRVKYTLWKDLIQRYFGKIGEMSPVARDRPASKLDFGPIPTIQKSSRKRDPPSPILTGERAMKQLAGIEQRKTRTQKGKSLLKKSQPQELEDFDEDIDEGYRQYMEMNGHFQHQSLPTPGPSGVNTGTDSSLTKEALPSGPKAKETKARKKNDKVIIEGSRRSSRLQARLKVVDCSEPVVPLATVERETRREPPIVLCTLCKSTGTEDDCNQCRICDWWVHNACFDRDIPKKHGIPSFCCPTCIDTFVQNRDMAK